MFDWYSEYLLSRIRQRDLAATAELRRLIAEGNAGRRSRKALEGRPGRRASLRYRLGSVLIVLGRSLQRAAPRLPEAPGR